MPLGERQVSVTFGCSCCTEINHDLPAWPGVTLWQLLRHMSILGWRVQLAPTIRLWCPICDANCCPPLPKEA